MKHKIKIFLNVLLGNAMLAFAVCAFVVPNDFLLGGSNGIALAIHRLVPALRLSVLTAVLNGVLFLIGWGFMGRQFAATSLLSTILYPILMAVFETLPLDTLFSADKLTCAIFCALLAGLGIGIVVRSGGSTGGMDIPPCILQKYKGIPFGLSLMVFDTATVLLQVCFTGLDGLLHSILIIMMISLTVNQTVVTGENKVQVIIISPAYEQIRREILESHDAGATMLQIETGYESRREKAVLSIIYAKKYPAIRDAVLSIDPHAFIVTSDVKGVNGKGYTLSRYQEEK